MSTVILNQGRVVSKVSKSGKQRFHMRIVAEPLIINTDPKALGAPVANAIAHHLRERVKAISASAAPATIAARKVAAKAFADGKSWAMKRYAGGRIGAKPPAQSDRAFNDSGRFAESIVAAGANDGSWRVNVAANRLSGDAGQVRRIWERLVQLVPAFGDIRALLSESDVVRARIRAQEALLSKGRATDKPATAWDVAKAAAKSVKLLAGLAA